jgi:hypothetical protein
MDSLQSNNKNNNERVLLAQGIEWAKAQREELIWQYIKALRTTEVTDFYRKLETDQLYKRSALNIDTLILRLEGQKLEPEHMKKLLVVQYTQGVLTFEITLHAAGLLQEVFKNKAQQDLAQNQPQVYATFMKKTEYIIGLMKSTMAAARIEALGQVEQQPTA